MRILLTGSLAYDYIMDFPSNFKDHLLPDKAHPLSASFLVGSLRWMRGGVAGNIAYSLALLGECSLVVATAGGDFEEYREWMESKGCTQVPALPDHLVFDVLDALRPCPPRWFLSPNSVRLAIGVGTSS